MTLHEHISLHGARKTAIALVDRRVQNIVGMSVHDLPDTAELCSIYDALEDVLSDVEGIDTQIIKEILTDIDTEFLHQLIY